MARDGLCKVWKVTTSPSDGVDSASISLDCVHSFTPFGGVSVTAVDICKSRLSWLPPAEWLVALGAESGELQVWRVRASSGAGYTSEIMLSVPQGHAHGATVRRIRWRPTSSQYQSKVECAHVDLASCGEDRTVRVHRINK